MGIFQKLREKKLQTKADRKKINIFAAYHKPAKLYENDIVTPMHVGRDVSFKASKDGIISKKDYKWLISNMIGDNTGDNISAKNRYFSETTVTYWIWKNCKAPITGLMHYRRLFNLQAFGNPKPNADTLKEYCIDEKTVGNLLCEYDIILPEKLGFGELTLYEQYKKYHYIEDLDLALDIIKEKYPYMSEAADQIKVLHEGYFFNMYITRKEIFDDYASFLFDILFELGKRRLPDRNNRTIYQQRIESFLAERLSSIYFNYMINNKGMRVCEVPILHIDKPVKPPKKCVTYKKKKTERSLTILIKFRF